MENQEERRKMSEGNADGAIEQTECERVRAIRETPFCSALLAVL